MKAKFLGLLCLSLILALPVFAQQPQTKQPPSSQTPVQDPTRQEPTATGQPTQPTQQDQNKTTGTQSDQAGQSTQAGAARKNIIETANDAGNFTTFTKMVEQAGLTDTLKSGNYTVFAPTDEAFAKIPPETLNSWMNDKDKSKKLVLAHVVQGNVSSADVAKMKTAKTAAGSSLTIKSADGKVSVGKGVVTQADISASNGTIHAIDTVLMP